MIDLNLKIGNIPAEREEEFRMKLRRAILQFVFETADSCRVPHTDISVDGDIKVVPDEMPM